MTVTVHPSVFKGSGQDGDFGWMVAQPSYATAFFIFNDNEGQFLEFQNNTANPTTAACSPGAGNGAMRPYQCQVPPRAGGVPTGSFAIIEGGPGYPKLTPQVQAYVDQAVAYIAQVIADNGYTDVYYSSDGKGGLGHGTFNPAKDVCDYIVQKIESLGKSA